MPDERAIMTYVSSYYHCFAGKIKVNLALHSTDVNLIPKFNEREKSLINTYHLFDVINMMLAFGWDISRMRKFVR